MRLLVHEARGDGSADALTAAGERVCQRLSHHAGNVLGVDTFCALLARSLMLVKQDFPFLGAVGVEPLQARLVGLRESLQEQTASQATEAIVAVLATFLALLAAFIGEKLSLAVLVEIWTEGSMGEES